MHRIQDHPDMLDIRSLKLRDYFTRDGSRVLDAFEQSFSGNIHPGLTGNGRLIPVSALVGDRGFQFGRTTQEALRPMFATDSYSVEDSVDQSVDKDEYLASLTERTPVLDYVTRRPMSGATSVVPEITKSPDMTRRDLGIGSTVSDSDELADVTDSDITIDGHRIDPKALILDIEIGRPSITLTDEWLQDVVVDEIRRDMESEFESEILRVAKHEGQNTVAVSSADYRKTNRTVIENLLRARRDVRDRHIRDSGSAFVLGTELYDRFVDQSVAGESFIRDGKIDVTPTIYSAQLQDGFQVNQPRKVQGIYGAWRNMTLAVWDTALIWVSDEQTMKSHLHVLVLYAVLLHRPRSVSNLIVTISRLNTPTGLLLTPEDGAIDAKWGDVNNAEEYLVQWKSGSQDYSEDRQENFYEAQGIVSGLANGVAHDIRVRAISTGYTDSDWSAAVSGTPSA